MVFDEILVYTQALLAQIFPGGKSIGIRHKHCFPLQVRTRRLDASLSCLRNLIYVPASEMAGVWLQENDGS